MSENTGKPDADDVVDAEIVPDLPTSDLPTSDLPTSDLPTSDIPTSPDPQGIGPGVTEPGFTQGGVPTFDGVRERIEKRVNTAIGAAELDDESPAGRTVAEQFAAREEAARKRLDEIRKSMRE